MAWRDRIERPSLSSSRAGTNRVRGEVRSALNVSNSSSQDPPCFNWDKVASRQLSPVLLREPSSVFPICGLRSFVPGPDLGEAFYSRFLTCLALRPE